MSLAELKRARRRGAPLVGCIPPKLLDTILCDAEPTTRSRCKCGSRPRPDSKHCSKRCAIAAAAARLCGTPRSVVLKQVVQQPQFPPSCKHCGRPARKGFLYCSGACTLMVSQERLRRPSFIIFRKKHISTNVRGSVESTTDLKWKPSLSLGSPPPYPLPMLTEVELQQINRTFKRLDAKMGCPTSPSTTTSQCSSCSSTSSISISDDESAFEIAPFQPTGQGRANRQKPTQYEIPRRANDFSQKHVRRTGPPLCTQNGART